MDSERRYRSHGEGNIRERGKGKWEARIRLDGKSRSFLRQDQARGSDQDARGHRGSR